MKFAKLLFGLAWLTSGALLAQEAKVTPLLSKDLTKIPDKEGLMIAVEYPPMGGERGSTARQRMSVRICCICSNSLLPDPNHWGEPAVRQDALRVAGAA